MAVSHFPMRGSDAYNYMDRIVYFLLGNPRGYFPVLDTQKITRPPMGRSIRVKD